MSETPKVGGDQAIDLVVFTVCKRTGARSNTSGHSRYGIAIGVRASGGGNIRRGTVYIDSPRAVDVHRQLIVGVRGHLAIVVKADVEVEYCRIEISLLDLDGRIFRPGAALVISKRRCVGVSYTGAPAPMVRSGICCCRH